MIERLVVLSTEDLIQYEDIPIKMRVLSDSAIGEEALSISNAVRKIETDMIIHALRQHGTQNRAARHLGINQGTLSRKVKKYGIQINAILHNQ